ncbi:MAG: hypothetical protein R2856_30475 [Caldilineaceae bacterium]
MNAGQQPFGFGLELLGEVVCVFGQQQNRRRGRERVDRHLIVGVHHHLRAERVEVNAFVEAIIKRQPARANSVWQLTVHVKLKPSPFHAALAVAQPRLNRLRIEVFLGRRLSNRHVHTGVSWTLCMFLGEQEVAPVPHQ